MKTKKEIEIEFINDDEEKEEKEKQPELPVTNFFYWHGDFDYNDDLDFFS